MPENTLLLTQASGYRRVRRVNSTDASFPTVANGAEPAESNGNAAAQTTRAVWNLAGNKGREDGCVQNLVKLTPIGVGADTNTFKMRVYGWHLLQEDGNTETEIWIAELLGEFTCTLTNSQTGAANRVLTATDYFCDSIAAAGTLDSKNYAIDIPGSDQIATVVIDMKGAKKLEVTFDRNSSATSCNCLAQQY